MTAQVTFAWKGAAFALAVFLALLVFVPRTASAAAVTLLNATSSSNNASTTLATIGDTVSFGLNLSGTPSATTTPVIWFPSSVIGFSAASTTMSGSGAWWNFSTTSASIWADGVITFQLGWGGTAGEATTTAIFTQAASTTFQFVTSDQTAPTAFTTGATSDGGGVESGVWTSNSVGVNVAVPVANDSTLVFGTIQLQARVNSGTWQDIGSAHTIVTGDLNGNVTVVLNERNIEEFADYAEDGVFEFRAVITDAVGNQTTGSASANTITIDVSSASTSSGGGYIGVYVPAPVVPALETPSSGSGLAALIAQLKELLAQYVSLGGTVTSEMAAYVGDTASTFARDLGYGSSGEDVRALQKFLNAQGFPVAASGPGSPGAETNLFGPATRAALIEFQKANGIEPAAGYFGPVTRGVVNAQ